MSVLNKSVVTNYIDTYLSATELIVHNLPREQIEAVVRVLADAWRRSATVFLLGNGGSAATASHMANDLNKLTIVPGQLRFKAHALTDNVPLITAWANDTMYENIFVEPMLNFLTAGDVVIGISGSGNSRNVVKALQVAGDLGAITVAFTGRDGGQLKSVANHVIFVPTDSICQQEDGHMILDHVISSALRQIIEAEAAAQSIPLAK